MITGQALIPTASLIFLRFSFFKIEITKNHGVKNISELVGIKK